MVVFNGEIYNFDDLREQLINRGHRFYTQTDTEVIPHLYEEHELDFVRQLRGMFAIALYDKRRRRLVLVRDRLGKKPLVYAIHGERLLFASEIRSIFAVAPELSEVKRESWLSFFQFGYIADPNTAFQGVYKLPPAHLLVWEHGHAAISEYWRGPVFSQESTRSVEEWLQRLEAELSNAVKMRLVSDVPLGAMLSGGVDSSSVVALMARASSEPVKTFCVTFPNSDHDEARYARRVAERFGTEHYELAMRPDILAIMEELTTLLEEPFGDSSLLPTYCVSRLVREHVTVALSGDGGDELFAGYDRYAIHLGRQRLAALMRGLGPMYRKAIFKRLPRDTRGRRFMYNITLPFFNRYVDSISHLIASDRDREIFTPELVEWAGGVAHPVELFKAYFDDSGNGACRLARLQYLDIKTYLAGDILPKVDRMSMAASLETRAPMLDHVLVELSANVPASLKLKNGCGKYLLKRLAERLGVPTEVIYRPKQGFAMPLVHWFRHELRDYMREVLTDRKCRERGIFNAKAVDHLLAEHGSGARDRSAEIWLLLMFELWHRNFLEPLRASGHLRPWRSVSICAREQRG